MAFASSSYLLFDFWSVYGSTCANAFILLDDSARVLFPRLYLLEKKLYINV